VSVEDPTTEEAQPEAPIAGPVETPEPTVAPEEATGLDRGSRKVRTGMVVSEKMDKTVVVRIDHSFRHSTYQKTVRKSSKLKVHDEANDAHVGDKVRVMETRPLSKTKRWRVVEIVERAK
jgi:small subunit ribosomal protein S17